MDRGTVRNM